MLRLKTLVAVAIISIISLVNSAIVSNTNAQLIDEHYESFKEESKILELITKLKNVNDYGDTDLNKLSKAIIKYSKEFDIPTNILIGIAYVESKMNKYVSNQRCIGIYQINERVHKLNQDKKYDEDYQVKKGCEILSQFLKIHNNDMYRALNGYNGRVNNNPYADKVMKIANQGV